jgi:hypothetical protein
MQGALLLFCCCTAFGAETAATIMERVAANQDRAQERRAQYRFHQNVLVRVQRANGKLAREEIREYRVTPTDKSLKRELLQLNGKVLDGSKIIPFTQTDFRYRKTDIDGEIVTNVIDDLGRTEQPKDYATDDHNRDGIGKDLFPLSTKAQKQYDFHLEGEEEYSGHNVYRITFTPKATEDKPWAGEALIDRDAMQPVVITTHLTAVIPTAVKIMLGTNIQNVRFKVTYSNFDGDVWFPVSYGGELRFRVLFMYARRVSFGLINSEFERAAVDTNVTFETP